MNAYPDFVYARELGELAREFTMEQVGMVQAVTGTGSYQAWMTLANQWLGWKPPSQKLEHSGGDKPIGLDFESMNPQERREKLEELLQKRAAKIAALTVPMVEVEGESGSGS
jgi:hypothetical protein